MITNHTNWRGTAEGFGAAKVPRVFGHFGEDALTAGSQGQRLKHSPLSRPPITDCLNA